LLSRQNKSLHDRYEHLAKKITLEKHYLAGAAFFHFGQGMNAYHCLTKLV
jgi:hypothetical protein